MSRVTHHRSCRYTLRDNHGRGAFAPQVTCSGTRWLTRALVRFPLHAARKHPARMEFHAVFMTFRTVGIRHDTCSKENEYSVDFQGPACVSGIPACVQTMSTYVL
jgi:hypothetical protein